MGSPSEYRHAGWGSAAVAIDAVLAQVCADVVALERALARHFADVALALPGEVREVFTLERLDDVTLSSREAARDARPRFGGREREGARIRPGGESSEQHGS